MKIPQVSVSIANQPGHLIAPCKVLAKAGINIVTLSLADQEQKGTLRLIVRDWQHALEVLTEANFAVTVKEVLAVEVSDRPGGLLELLAIFEQARINVESMYAFTSRLGESAVMVFCFQDLDAAIIALTRAGINPVSPVTLFDRLEGE